MSGFLQARRGEDVDDLVGHDRLAHDLADRVVELLVGLPLARDALGEHGTDGLVEADVVADRDRLVGRDGQRERRRELGHGLEQPRLAVLLGEDVLLRGREQREPLLGVAGHPGAVVEAVEQARADLVLLEHERDRLGLVDRGLAGPARLRVRRERLAQLVGDARGSPRRGRPACPGTPG